MTQVDAQNPRVTVWYTRCPVPTGLGLAIHLGLLEQEFAGDQAAELRLLQSATQPQILQSHFTHTLDNSLRHGGNIPAIWARANGADTKVIGLSFVRGPQTVLALPGSGIRSAADLKGKRLLLQRRPDEDIDFVYATALRTYEQALQSVGLGLDDVVLVEQVIRRRFVADRLSSLATGGGACTPPTGAVGRYSELLFPLIRGEVDAIASGTIGSPTPQMEFFFGLQRVFDLADLDLPARANNSTPLTFAVSRSLIEQHPALLERILLRILQANHWAAGHNEEALRLIAKEQSTAETIASAAFGHDIASSLALDFDAYKIAALKAQKDYLLHLGLLPADFSLDDWLDPRPLQQAQALFARRVA